MSTTSDDLLFQQAQTYGLDAVTTLEGLSFPQRYLSGISSVWAEKNQALPAMRGEESVMLSVRPDCLDTLQQAQLMVGHTLHPLLVTGELLREGIRVAFHEAGTSEGVEKSREGVVSTRIEGAVSEAVGPVADDATIDLVSTKETAPPVRTLNALLLEAIRKQASDIHFEPFPGGLRVRFRMDGGLYEQSAPPPSQADAILSRLKVMARMDIAERRLPQDGMAQVRAAGRIVDIRVSSVPVADGERLVLRLLDRNNAWLPLDHLGMESSVLQPFTELLTRPHGLIVVSGPTGSGKTTTLYSALSTLDSVRRNILTVEDPVEYRLPSIGQIQVKPKIGLTFAAGLRHILRQDPDVILVGETRDPETAEIAVRAALTGHLVFTTLHTNDAPSVVARLVDIGIEPYLLASCLRGVLAQRLVRRLCPQCRVKAEVPSTLSSTLANALRAHWATLPEASPQMIYSATGCSNCLEGYRGRLGLFEYMGSTPDVSEAIRLGHLDNTSLQQAAASQHAYLPLAYDAACKLATGTTDLAEVLTALL